MTRYAVTLTAGCLLTACAVGRPVTPGSSPQDVGPAPSSISVSSAPAPSSTGPQSPSDTQPAQTNPPTQVTQAGPSAQATQPAPMPQSPPVPQPAAGRLIVIDPGHNGGNAANPKVINAPVPDGTGGTKPCNTTGTATNGGYAEHAFTWDVALKLQAILQAKGFTVKLTRPDDSGIGPCVDKRAQLANDANAAAVISIHGDGSAAGSHGFFCMTSPVAAGGAAIMPRNATLAADVRDGIVATGVMPTANYEGTKGIDSGRTDLAGLNLSKVPTTMCELGNMRSSVDSAIQTSDTGRAQLAAGIAAGLTAFLA